MGPFLLSCLQFSPAQGLSPNLKIWFDVATCSRNFFESGGVLVPSESSSRFLTTLSPPRLPGRSCEYARPALHRIPPPTPLFPRLQAPHRSDTDLSRPTNPSKPRPLVQRGLCAPRRTRCSSFNIGASPFLQNRLALISSF